MAFVWTKPRARVLQRALLVEAVIEDDPEGTVVPSGTSCKRSGCKHRYGEDGDTGEGPTSCLYAAGQGGGARGRMFLKLTLQITRMCTYLVLGSIRASPFSTRAPRAGRAARGACSSLKSSSKSRAVKLAVIATSRRYDQAADRSGLIS